MNSKTSNNQNNKTQLNLITLFMEREINDSQNNKEYLICKLKIVIDKEKNF